MILAPLSAALFALAGFTTIPPQPDAPPAPNPTIELAVPQEDGPAPTPEELFRAQREALPALYDELAAAPDAAAAEVVATQIEALWDSSGSATADLLTERAGAAMAAEDPEMAARHMDDALRIAPDYAQGWVRRAQLYSASDQPSEALDALGRALTADPRNYRALLTMANTLESMESMEGAYEAYGEALKVHPFLEEAIEERERLAPLVEGRDL